jgi:hypothetical protein
MGPSGHSRWPRAAGILLLLIKSKRKGAEKAATAAWLEIPRGDR